MPSDNDTWIPKYFIVTYVLLVCIANDRCIPGTRTPSSEDLVERGCQKIECPNAKPACLKWSFLASGSVENITYACVGNRDNRKGKFEVDWSKKDDSDKKKKLNEKTYKVEVFLCSKDYCNGNGAVRHLLPSVFVWTFPFVLCYSSFFVNKW